KSEGTACWKSQMRIHLEDHLRKHQEQGGTPGTGHATSTGRNQPDRKTSERSGNQWPISAHPVPSSRAASLRVSSVKELPRGRIRIDCGDKTVQRPTSGAASLRISDTRALPWKTL